MSDFIIVNSISFVAEAVYTVLFTYLFMIMSPVFIIFIGVTLSCAGVFFSSYIISPALFCWVYGISIGVLSATIFLPSVWILWNVMPAHKGTTSGIILGGYSFGPVPFLLIFTYIANPYNYAANESKNIGEITEKYFGKDVSDRVPMAIQWMAILFYIVCLVGLACLPKKWVENHSDDDGKKKTITLIQMIETWKFWYFVVLILLGFGVQAYFFNMYRILGMIYINDDHFLAYVGSFSFAVGVVGRIGFGILLDKYSWKKINSISYFLQGFLSICLYFALESKLFFQIIIISLGFLGTSVFNGALILAERVFSKDKWVFSYMCLSYVIVFFLPYITDKYITPYVGYFITLCFIGMFGIIASIFSLWPPEPLSYKFTEYLLTPISE